MNILLASDDNYAPLLGVTIYSCLKSNKLDFDIFNIFILDGGISNINKTKIESICDEANVNYTLKFIKYDNLEDILGIEIKSTRPLATYARLFSATLIDESIDKIIYIDCDALVVDSLKELWQINIERYYCAGVLDAGPTYINTFLGLPETHEHFNAGLLLINLKLWREDNLEKSFLDYIFENDGRVFHNDQGVINVICKDKILKIDPKYNILSPFFEVGYDKVLQWYGINEYYTKQIVENALKHPVFIHLTQFVNGRPWFTNASNHPLRLLFDSYAQKTPFKNEVYVEDNRHIQGKLLSFSYKLLPYSLICFLFKIYRIFLTKFTKGSI